jgi:hypothetical protein
MRSARGKSSESGDGGEEQQEQCVSRKTMVVEWGGLITLRCYFYFTSGNLRQILTVYYEGEMAE